MNGRLLGCGRRALAIAVLAVLTLCGNGVAMALQPNEVLADRELEQRARKISLGLRCLVCQNQSIDDSDAEVAQDLRRVVRQRLVAGDSDARVIDYIVDRYGDFVLLKPPFNVRTIVLWGSPVVVLLFGGALVLLSRRNARREIEASSEGANLSPSEQQELQSLLDDKAG